MYKFAIVNLTSAIFLILLNGCSGNNPSILVNELSSNIVSYDEVIRINNCGGKADSEQTASRSFATTFGGGAEISAGYPGVVEGGISAKYSQYRNITKSQRLIAPPGTNMEFVLRWSEEIHAGNVTVNGSSGDYEVRVPVSVEQVSSQDLNHCNGDIQIPTPASNLPAPVAEGSEATPTTLAIKPVNGQLAALGCFNAELWKVSAGKSISPGQQNGCWQMTKWGWTAIENGLSIFIKNSKDGDTYGIYTPVSLNTEISFNIQIDRLYSLGDTASATVSIGIVDSKVPDKGAFLIFNETTNPLLAEFQTGNSLKSLQNMGRYYQYSNQSEVRVVLQGVKVSIYINKYQVPDIPINVDEPSFWIGNRFNTGGDVNVTINNLVITNK